MTVRDLFEGIPLRSPVSKAVLDRRVKGIAYDSRKSGEGYLFFAFPGAKVDGREFAVQALGKGAVAAVSELPPPAEFHGPWIQVDHGRRTLAAVAGRFYGHPDRRLSLIGITGTNGKTTTAYLIDSILQQAGKVTALIGTIEYRLAGRTLPAVNTTPESLDLFELFMQLEELGGTHATMEVSSHALALGRVHGIQFHTAVWTNLTRDHLDFHHTMNEYFAAKQLLFSGTGTVPPRCAVINHDDAHGRSLKIPAETEVLWYGLEDGAAVRAVRISSDFAGLHFEIQHGGRTYAVESPLVGKVNVYNILAAWCAAVSEGIPSELILRGIASMDRVPGRFERVDEGQPFLAVVDYAHTDDALRNTILSARALTEKRVVTLFGCGGDRDRSKRPLMGKVAAELSDIVVVTSDNPRSEDPLVIINDALVGVRRLDTPHFVEPDREKAIRKAIEQAAPGDVVIIAGKGHETYQVLRDRTIHFDDREVVRTVLRAFGYQKDQPED
jgi:UDP-N-acetylmuramoyl-L-alanyl-D-glutamate--2,6-diaminopimelate ligase